MIEFLNGLTNAQGAEGLESLKAQNSAELNPMQAQEFQSLLSEAGKQAEPDADLANLLKQNFKGKNEMAMNQMTEENMAKLLEGKTPEEAELLLKAQSEESQKTTLLDAFSGKTKVKAHNIEQTNILTPQVLNKGKLKTSGELRMGLNSNPAQDIEVLKGQDTLANKLNSMTGKMTTPAELGKASTEATFLDPRLGPQVHMATPKKVGKGSIQTQVQYSEDFMTQKIEQGANGKTKVTGNNQALNLFSKEQSVLSDTGIINTKNISNVETGQVNFDSEKVEKLTGQFDEISSFKESNTSLNQGPFIGNKEVTASVTTSATDTKVLDLSNIQNPEQLLKEISSYIESSRIQNGRDLEVIVNHKDLGQFKVNASKGDGGMIDLQITAASEEAHAFFNKNEVSLLKTLNGSGVKVADFKLSANFSMNDTQNSNSSGNDSTGQNSSGNQQGFGRQSNGGNSQDQGRQRRQELWDQYRERQGA